MNTFRKLSRNSRGAAALEFALTIPLFLLLLTAIAQFAMGFFASAGLRNGVEAAARFAQIYPVPSDDKIENVMTSNVYGLNLSQLSGPSVTHGTANGVNYVDVNASYAVPIDILFIPAFKFNINYTRRAYQYQ